MGKKCEGNIGSDYFGGCGIEKHIHRYGLCTPCFAKFLYTSIKGKEILGKSIPRAKIQVKKQVSKKIRKDKKEIKSLSQEKSDLQKLVNKIARLLDIDKGCHSCNHGWNNNFTRQVHGDIFFR